MIQLDLVYISIMLASIRYDATSAFNRDQSIKIRVNTNLVILREARVNMDKVETACAEVGLTVPMQNFFAEGALKYFSTLVDTKHSQMVFGLKLRYQYLCNSDFSKLQFDYSDFSYSNFTHTIMHKVGLRHVALVGANLSHVDLTGTDLTGADLTNVHLDDVNLTDVTLYAHVEEYPDYDTFAAQCASLQRVIICCSIDSKPVQQ